MESGVWRVMSQLCGGRQGLGWAGLGREGEGGRGLNYNNEERTAGSPEPRNAVGPRARTLQLRRH